MSAPFVSALAALEPARRYGHVRAVSAGKIEADGPLSSLGDVCRIEPDGALAEVVAVLQDRIVLVPLDHGAHVNADARVELRPTNSLAPVGAYFSGRAIDAMGAPMDSGGAIVADDFCPLDGAVMAPMERRDPRTPLETGIRALDGLLTIGRGQRIGIFSASGVGKTTLMRQLALQVACDHCVLCLVGERGREVEAAWRQLSASGDRARFTCVAATSDLSAPLRVRAVNQALALAEYWRDGGAHVLLIVDSITRFAMALREIGLAAGAPPTLRAYTPNVFAALPRVVERCGAAGAGSITAVMTVLAETDDVDDPIVELMKSLLDGHIVLSRRLAEQGHFPAIDIVRSVSRQSDTLVTPPHAAAAQRARALLAAYEEASLMIESGIYKPGADIRIDEAVQARAGLLDFLRQTSNERTPLAETLAWLITATAKGARHG